jgi:hypothetical protein
MTSQLKFFRVMLNTKGAYNVLKYLDNSDVLNLFVSCQLLNSALNENKAILKNACKKNYRE